jgi:putative ABC transport system permease protein
MLNYYFLLAWRSIRSQSGLSFLIASTLGIGIAACTITFSLIYLMSADPLPSKSQRIFRVQVDNWSPHLPAIQPDLPPELTTWHDANNIVAAKKAKYQAASAFTWGMVTPSDDEVTPFLATIRVANGDFFSIFNFPFKYGEGWSNQPVNETPYVVVLSKESNDRLFQGENSVGKTIPMLGELFTVVGVLDEWKPSPKFYDVTLGPYYQEEDIYIPLALKPTLELPHGGATDCWEADLDEGYHSFLNSECVNFLLWVELENESDKVEFVEFLNAYVQEQKALGRFPRPLNNRLLNLTEWLDYKKIVGNDVHLFFWLSLLFLFVCLCNAASLLSTSFTAKINEMSLRRALGASQQSVVSQFFIEAAMLGMLGGLLGLILSLLGLEGIKQLYTQYQQLIKPDFIVVLTSLFVSLLAGLLAGVIPIFRICRLPPAQQLKQD